MTSKTAVQLTAERGSTHGDYGEMSRSTMDIMRAFQAGGNWETLPDTVQVFFFNVAQKAARILTGNPYEPDHYADIGGYAHLAQIAVAPPAAPAPEEPLQGVVSPEDLEKILATLPQNTHQASELIPGGPLIADGMVFGQGLMVAGGLAPGEGSVNDGASGFRDPEPDVLAPALVAAGLTSGLTPRVDPTTAPEPLPAAATAPTEAEGDTGLAPLATEPDSTEAQAQTPAPRPSSGRPPARRFP